jgi:hypothetical protein
MNIKRNEIMQWEQVKLIELIWDFYPFTDELRVTA